MYSSDDSQFDLQSSDLNQCVQGIDDSITFVQNIDFESFSHIDDGGGNDDDSDYNAGKTDNNADDHTGDGDGNDDNGDYCR